MVNSTDFNNGVMHFLDYLTAEYDESGTSLSSPNNIQFYYKLPSILTVAGRYPLALRILRQT